MQSGGGADVVRSVRSSSARSFRAVILLFFQEGGYHQNAKKSELHLVGPVLCLVCAVQFAAAVAGVNEPPDFAALSSAS